MYWNCQKSSVTAAQCVHVGAGRVVMRGAWRVQHGPHCLSLKTIAACLYSLLSTTGSY